MNSTDATLTAKAPHYAPDGSHGYFLTVTRERGSTTGWIYAKGCAVYATIDRAPWQRVGTVASPANLTLDWITKHVEAILLPF